MSPPLRVPRLTAVPEVLSGSEARIRAEVGWKVQMGVVVLVAVMVGVPDGVTVAVFVRVDVTVEVAVLVSVFTTVLVGVAVGVRVVVRVALLVAVCDGVEVGLLTGVLEGVEVGPAGVFVGAAGEVGDEELLLDEHPLKPMNIQAKPTVNQANFFILDPLKWLQNFGEAGPGPGTLKQEEITLEGFLAPVTEATNFE